MPEAAPALRPAVGAPDEIERILDLPVVHSLVPDHDSISLVAYYPQFRDYYRECELQTKRWFVDNMRPDWIICDVGANVGYYSVLFSRLATRGQIFAFEPTDTIRLLERNLTHNGADNVQPLQLALGAQAGEIEENIFRIWGRDAERKVYDFSTLDAFVCQRGLTRLDCLKIDVDSFDFEVLRGGEEALKRFNPWIVVELNHALAKRNQSVPEALEWLLARGYREALVLDSENYVLRRDEERAGAGQAAMSLRFEHRPILLPPAFEKGPAIANMFTSILNKHGSAKATPNPSPGALVRIEAPGPQWAYAASIKMTSAMPGPGMVELDVALEGAAVGLGCMNADVSAFVGREVTVQPAPGRQRIHIAVDDLLAAHRFMIRNVDPVGATGFLTIFGMQACAAIPVGRQNNPLLRQDRRRLSLAEIDGALAGLPLLPSDPPQDRPGIDIVAVDQLDAALGFKRPYLGHAKVIRHPLAHFNMARDEGAMFRYLFEQSAPRRHLEFGTWEGQGTVFCASSCAAEIWTINLPDGEVDANGNPLYSQAGAGATGVVRTDSGSSIGWRYRAAGYADRVHQILCDSREFDTRPFAPGFFDSVFVDGGHTAEVMTSDTEKSLPLLRAGGLMIWHDFCPEPETLKLMGAPRGVVRAMVDNWARWSPQFSRLFWVRPSWTLIGVKA